MHLDIVSGTKVRKISVQRLSVYKGIERGKPQFTPLQKTMQKSVVKQKNVLFAYIKQETS